MALVSSIEINHTISIYPTFPARGETNKRESASTFTFQIAEHALHDDVRSLRAGGASAAVVFPLYPTSQ